MGLLQVDLRRLHTGSTGVSSSSDKQYAVRGTSATVTGLEPGSQYGVTVTPVYGTRLGTGRQLKDVWTEPLDPPPPIRPQVGVHFQSFNTCHTT